MINLNFILKLKYCIIIINKLTFVKVKVSTIIKILPFTAVEKLLSSSAGKYCVGDEITLADCCLVPQIFNARRFHVDLRPFPTILRVDRHLEGHPAFTAAHPNNQPDCPPEATK